MNGDTLEVSKNQNGLSINFDHPLQTNNDKFWNSERARIISAIEKYFLSEKEALSKNGFKLNQVRIQKQGKWHVVSGSVDSHRTKVRYLSLVPKGKDGMQWIVDRLMVHRQTISH